jgi:hypothetical protein
MDWKPVNPMTPTDRVLLGCWLDGRGDHTPVLIRFEPSNLDSNHGFIGLHGQRYGAGGIIAYAEFVMPGGAVPGAR